MFFLKKKLLENITQLGNKNSFPIKLHFNFKQADTSFNVTKKTSIKNIRQWIQKNEDIQQNQQIVLIYSGKIMHNEDITGQYKIKENSVIDVIIRDDSKIDALIKSLISSN